MDSHFKLRHLTLLPRLGIAALVLVILGGIAASMAQIRLHYAPRDGDPAFSLTDIQGAYHGVTAPSALLESIETRKHPPELAQNKRDALVKWLKGNRIPTDYDNLDLGDFAPAEIIAGSCLSCHGRGATDPIAKRVPLDDWESVKRFAYDKSINPTPTDKLVVSTHAHSLTLATLTLVLVMLLLMTTWPRRVVEVGAALLGVSLLVDLGGWWLAREAAGAVWLVIAGGGVFNASVVVACVLVLLELLKSRR